MKLLCGIIMGDVKTGEGTRTALQLTCCMANDGAMICCSKVYLFGRHNGELQAQHEIASCKQTGVCVCACSVIKQFSHGLRDAHVALGRLRGDAASGNQRLHWLV